MKYLSILRINWIHALEYRANALIGLFAILSGLFIEYQIWSLIFESNNTVIKMSGTDRPFSFEQLMVFIFLSIIVGQLKSSWVTSSQMIMEIRQGIINKYLIRPISYFGYHLMMFIGINSLYIIVYMSLLILFVFIYPGLLFNSFTSIVGFVISLLLSIYLSYCIYFIMVWGSPINSCGLQSRDVNDFWTVYPYKIIPRKYFIYYPMDSYTIFS